MDSSPTVEPGHCPHCGRYVLDFELLPDATLTGGAVIRLRCKRCRAIVPVMLVGTAAAPVPNWSGVRVILRA